MKKLITLLTLLTILTACNQSGTSTRVVDGDPEPPAPSGPKDAWINWTEVEGVDRDQDGVRDDVEIWINNHGEDEYIRKALKQEWKARVQFIKLFDIESDKNKLWQKEKKLMGRARECYKFLTAVQVNDSIDYQYTKMLSNLRPVNIAVAKYSELFAGMTEMSSGFYGLYLEGETYCDFPVSHKMDLKLKIKKTYFPDKYHEDLAKDKYERAKNWSQL